jgi:hypothetical protein
MTFIHISWLSFWAAFFWGCVAGWLADKAWRLLWDSLRAR